MTKLRLDLALVDRGFAESRAKAQALIMAGQVKVNGDVVIHPSEKVTERTLISIERGPRFVSRGGEKLEAAIEAFQVKVTGQVCADVGASTGGFTDCLLQHGARRVFAIDVGKGLLAWKLRQDPRVEVMEETNARYLTTLREPVTLITVDASFISLKILLPVVKNWFGKLSPLLVPNDTSGNEGRVAIVLIKPQFEAGRKEAAKGRGVIRDPAIHRQVLTNVLTGANEQGFATRGLMCSPLLGPKGNVEFLAWLELSQIERGKLNSFIDQAMKGFPVSGGPPAEG